MAVFERGYRPYAGGFGSGAPWIPIAREAYGTAVRSVAFRRIRVLFFLWFACIAFLLYIQVGTDAGIFLRRGLAAALPEEEVTPFMLKNALRVFYTGVAVLTALLSVLVGAGLVADDLATRALPLYLVRPLRARDYVLGKTLVIPLVLVWMALLPGVAFYLLVGFWQPPGETAAFLRGNLDVLVPVLEHYAIAATSYTGLVLLLSSRSPRRVAVAVVAAAIVLGGTMLRVIAFGSRMEGPVGDVMRHLALPTNSVAPFLREVWPRLWARGVPWLPDRTAVWAVSLALFLLGLYATWRRARSVEVTG